MELKKWISEQKEMPTALVCGNDVVAIGEIQMLKGLKLRFQNIFRY